MNRYSSRVQKTVELLQLPTKNKHAGTLYIIKNNENIKIYQNYTMQNTAVEIDLKSV